MQHKEQDTDSGISKTITISSPSIHNSRTSCKWFHKTGLRKCCMGSTVKKRIPIIQWLPKYKKSYIFQDILAGITVGFTAIPQGIAYAAVAGLPPQYGLYSGIMGCFMYMVLGTSKDVIMGTTAITSLMIRPHVDAIGPDIAVLACFLNGCIAFAVGVLQLGFLVDFISFPVVAGFTTAAAITISSAQITGLFGIPSKSNEFLPAWKAVIEHIPEAKLGDSLLAVGSISFLLIVKYLGNYGNRQYNPEWSRKRNYLGRVFWALSLSRNTIIVVFGTALAWAMSQDGSNPFTISGEVAQGLPSFQLPPFNTVFENRTYTFIDMTKQLGPTIVFMPFVVILETIAVTKTFSKGKSVDASQEMIATGLANVASAFISSMSVTASFSRTALNNASGSMSPLGGVFSAFTVILALQVLTSTFYYIPKPILSAVTICAVIFMVELRIVRLLWRTKKLELILYFKTLIASVFLGIEYGILIGIATNLLFIIWSNARPPISIVKTQAAFKEVELVTLTQSLHFPAAEYIRNEILEKCDIDLDIILDGQYVLTIDMTVAKNIKMLVDEMKIRQQNIILWNFNDNVKNCCLKLDPTLEKYFCDGELDEVVKNTNVMEIDIQT